MRDKKTNISLAIFTVLPLLFGFVETRASLGHLQADDWPAHALFHVAMGLGGLLAAYGLILILTWGPLRRGERWAWYAIGCAAFTVHGSQLVGDLVTGGGLRNQQGIVANGATLITAVVIAVLSYGVGLALSWPHTQLRPS